MAPINDPNAQVSSRDDAEDLIELEPKISLLDSVRSAAKSLSTAHAQGTLASLTSESDGLLRTRLLAASLFLAIAYAVFSAFGWFAAPTALGMAVNYGVIRAVLSALVAGLLASPLIISAGSLRILVYAYFALMVLVGMATQYVTGTSLISQGDLVHLVALEKNGVINTIVLMILFGVLIPNDPREIARVVLTMALGPVLVLVALRFQGQEAAGLIKEMASGPLEIGNMLFVLMGASLAIYAAYVLHGLRRDLHKARRLGQYELGKKLGEGGMGEVYLAEHQFLKRPCALKLIKPETNTNPVSLARFEREVQAAAMLSHPNSIEIYDYGHTDDGTFYYVMEYLPGLSIADLVKQFGPVEPGRAVYLMRQVCGALSEAHRLGLVHRDLKPPNIIVAILGGKCDVAKVLDFGLVKLTDTPDAPQLTAEYTVSGTPQYMSPEQASADSGVDARADIYSVGGILYYMLTGRPPFEGTNPTELMISHARDAVTPPSRVRPDIPADLEAVVLRCLEKKADDRYPDARALSIALGACGCAGDWDEGKAELWWTARAQDQAAENVAAVSA